MRSQVIVALSVLALLSACRGKSEPPSPTPTPSSAPTATATPVAAALEQLPNDKAGHLIARAIDAAGGWKQWESHRDVSLISTLSIFDRIGSVVSETILLQRSPLHEGLRTRVESIGLDDEVSLGFDEGNAWMMRDGKAITDALSMAFLRFNAVSSHYWFGLPFILAESPVRLSYLGSEAADGRQWEKVRVDFPDRDNAPADWMVLYVDADSGLLGRVLGHVTVEFLRHPLWLAKLREYREWGGLKKERRRTIFPADENGNIIGTMAAEQLVEHVHFDNGFPPSMFTKPLAAGGGSPAA